MTGVTARSARGGRVRRLAGRCGLDSHWAFVSALTLVYWLAPQSVRVFYPLRLQQLGASDLVIGLAVASSSVAGLLLAVPSGYLLDRFDHRRVLIATTAGLAVTSALFAWVPSVPLMVALMFTQGMFQMWVWLVLQALITGVGTGPRGRRQLSMFSLAWGVGLAAGPSAGAWVYGAWGFAPVSLVCGALCAAGVGAAYFVPWRGRRAEGGGPLRPPDDTAEEPKDTAEELKDTAERADGSAAQGDARKPGRAPRTPPAEAADGARESGGADPAPDPGGPDAPVHGGGFAASLRHTFGDAVVFGVMVSTFVNNYVQSLRLSFYPLFLEREGVPVGFVGVLLSCLGGSSLGVRIVLPALVRRLGHVRLLLGGTWTAIAGIAVTPLSTDTAVLVVGALMIGCGLGTNPPITVNLLAAADHENHGLAAGFRMVANRSAQVVQPVVFGGLAGAVGLAAAFPVSGLLLGAGTVWMARRLAKAGIT
ncbi:MFS transporter [Streptomyces sp. NPDC050560]|uniref:MFS transporter n=1 Tax=Streptomyces sp. NPDC050560 TaxID=3365630 RepID=UPI00379D6F80